MTPLKIQQIEVRLLSDARVWNTGGLCKCLGQPMHAHRLSVHRRCMVQTHISSSSNARWACLCSPQLWHSKLPMQSFTVLSCL